MKYLGIDYGAKRIGIAISDADGKIAFPRTVVQNNDTLLSTLRKLTADERVEAIIVGDTRAFAGLENLITKDVETFAEELKRNLELPVTLASEAGSSIEASRYAEKGNEHNDAAAAAVILQRYLEMHPNAIE